MSSIPLPFSLAIDASALFRDLDGKLTPDVGAFDLIDLLWGRIDPEEKPAPKRHLTHLFGQRCWILIRPEEKTSERITSEIRKKLFDKLESADLFLDTPVIRPGPKRGAKDDIIIGIDMAAQETFCLKYGITHLIHGDPAAALHFPLVQHLYLIHPKGSKTKVPKRPKHLLGKLKIYPTIDALHEEQRWK